MAGKGIVGRGSGDEVVGMGVSFGGTANGRQTSKGGRVEKKW